MKHFIKKTWMVSLSILLTGAYVLPVSASEENRIETGETKEVVSDGTTYEYTSIDQNGNIQTIRLPEIDEEEIEQERLENADSYEMVMKIGDNEEVIATYDDKESAEKAQEMRKYYRTTGTTSIRAVSDYSNIKYGVVDFHTKGSSYNTYFTETQTGEKGYLNGAYASDGAFLGYCTTDKSQIKFRQAGVEGCVNASDVIVRDYDSNEVKSVNFYRAENGYIYHYITTNVKSSYYPSVINFGPQQSYMKNNTVYYSYDGHYFYTSYNAMITDYKANTYANAINANQPYYNYYQYLTHRTKTNITASQFDAYVDSMTVNSSVMKGMGSYFIQNQNTYGANALLMFAVAANESYWGVSEIALAKNNLFGHNATDYNPSGNANKYASPQDSIEHHARDFVSNNYLDPKDYSGLYHGGHLGDKASGMNVKYASDSYWGEKAAGIAFLVDKKNGNVDINKYQIGIVSKMTNLQVRKEASTSSTALYKTGNWATYPVVILAQTTGTSISGNNVWYKIQSDPTLSSDRNSMTQDVKVYDFNTAYGYVSSAYVDKVVYTNGNAEIPDDGGYARGDVNGDGKISSMDYVLVKNHILRIQILSGKGATAGDVNKDGTISSMDYVLIKNHILGISKIQ